MTNKKDEARNVAVRSLAADGKLLASIAADGEAEGLEDTSSAIQAALPIAGANRRQDVIFCGLGRYE